MLPVQLGFVGDSFVAGIGDETALGWTGPLSARFHQLWSERDVPHVDVFSPLERHPVWHRQVLEGDGAHPRSEGYTALYELVAPAWDRWMDSTI